MSRSVFQRHRSASESPDDARSDRRAGVETSAGPEAAPVLHFDRIGKFFLRNHRLVEAVHKVSLTVSPGEFVCVVGPSGCGKSTLLNMAAGIMKPTMGQVSFRGAPVPMPNTQIGYITQADNLLPWRTASKNVQLPLLYRGVPQRLAADRAKRVMDLVGLTGFEDALPRELSGGMRKRVGLARTLVYEPDVILADEPFGALDAQLKHVLQGEILRICESVKTTIVFVTHDIGEAVTVADRVIVFSARPGTIVDDCAIELPRPRNIATLRSDPAYGRAYERIWGRLSPYIAKGEDV